MATAFHDLILNKIHDSVPTIAVSEGQYVDLTVATSSLVFLSAFDLGEATITIGVSQTATASRIFYDASADGGATANYTDHAAIRLQSTDLNPISIEFAETGNEIGLLENNVGDTTWDANSATFQTTGQAGVAVSGLSVSTSEGANEALDVLNTAIQDISDMRSNLGAIENRLGHTVSTSRTWSRIPRRPSPVSRTRTSRWRRRPWPGLRSCNRQELRCWHRPTRRHRAYSASWVNEYTLTFKGRSSDRPFFIGLITEITVIKTP